MSEQPIEKSDTTFPQSIFLKVLASRIIVSKGQVIQLSIKD